MTIECPDNDCDGSVDPEDLEAFPFHDPVQCPECKRWWNTDWDYLGYDSMGWWFTGTEALCPSIRPAREGYGCELYLGHDGQHSALNGKVTWTIGKCLDMHEDLDR